jgi:hypothetical protein
LSKGTVQLDELAGRQSGYKMGELTLEHQREKITADCRGARQAVFWTQHDLRCKSQDFPIDRGADDRGDIFMLGDERSRDHDVKAWLSAAFGDALAGTVDLAPPQERACSAMSARAWRARRLRCLRRTALSIASTSRRRSRSANSRSAVRTSADRLRREVPPVNSFSSFNVSSSIVTAIVFILAILSTNCADLNIAQAHQPTTLEFAINLKTAKQTGLTIPPNVPSSADKVIK